MIAYEVMSGVTLAEGIIELEEWNAQEEKVAYMAGSDIMPNPWVFLWYAEDVKEMLVGKEII